MENFSFNFTPPPAQPGQVPPQGQQPQAPQPSSSKDAKKLPAEPSPELLHLMDEMNSSMRRLRVIEERYSNIQRKNQLTDQNMLANQKKVATELKSLNQELGELKEEIAKLKDTLSLVIQELKECAKKDELAVLDKYLKLWEPVRFVTQNQVERIVRDSLDSYMQQQQSIKQKDKPNL